MFHTKFAMNKFCKTALFIVPLLIIFSLSTLVPFVSDKALADRRTLSWSVVNTPSAGPTKVIVSPCEINAMALGPDNRTVYCVDTADNSTYKSIDAGYNWSEIGSRLPAAGALPPVWDIAVAPDDVNFVITITDNGTFTGPGRVFFSVDGGANWQPANFPALLANEYISCLDISLNYASAGTVRDIAVGTRSNAGPGRVFNCHYSTTSPSNWLVQDTLSDNDSISSIKFSPNYFSDYTIAVISSDNSSTKLNLGQHDPTSNTTSWNSVSGVYTGYPITIQSDIITSDNTTVIRTGLELPRDFNGTDIMQRACFASILTDNATAVVYLNTNLSRPDYKITPPSTGVRISSIAYSGSQSTGILLAGEANADAALGMANIWQCSNPQTTTPGGATWFRSNAAKSPTGGGTSGRANTILKWSDDGQTAYCGTSSENTTLGGTSWSAGYWPFAKTTGFALDESAFSRSIDYGLVWNQTGLIDTYITRLSDVAVHELPEGAESTTQTNILYLASLNDNSALGHNRSFDSVWRSLSDPPVEMWERILTRTTSDNGTILRINQRGDTVSKVVAFADLYTENITYSNDTGQTWETPPAGVKVQDMCFFNDVTLYLLEDYSMRRIARSGSAWVPGKKINTNMEAPAHTICTPIKTDTTTEGKPEEIAVVGTRGTGDSYVGWIDLTKFNPQFEVLKVLPEQGDVHVVADSKFEYNRTIYAAQKLPQDSDSPNQGSIYRWTLGISTDWDNLEPLNRAFYGIETINDVLYGAWYYDTTYNQNGSGADRTLYPTIKVPPPPEWDDLTEGLPPINNPGPRNVAFKREPTSLHISSNRYNTLWAIDDTNYTADNRTGCLWSYIDSVARVGPWPIAPPTGSFIGTDPVTGRSQQIDYKWRQLQDIKGYDLLLAKDVDFTLPLSQNLNLTPVDNLTGAWMIIPADWQDPAAWMAPGVLESGRPYYWRVRGRLAISNEIIHSPWSPVMFFSVKPGFMVTTFYPGPTLLSPVNGPCTGCKPPIGFSWTPVKTATKYEFLLASDPDLNSVITKAYTTATSYEYKDSLEHFKPYYWRVRAVAPVASDPSPVATFSLTDGIQRQDSLITQAIKSVAPGVPIETLIWIIIALAYLLILLIIIYAFVSRRG